MTLTLYERTNYVNKNIPFIVNKNITEYDMKEAGFNIIKQYRLLSDDKIRELSMLTKDERKIEIGKEQNNDKEFRHNLKDGFMRVRKEFMEKNGMVDRDILSVKNDAIFTTRICEHLSVGNIQFIPNMYTSYYFMGGIEFYYTMGKLDIKGIGDENIRKHEGYMMAVLENFFRNNENGLTEANINLILQFVRLYKERELDVGYYREFSASSKFRLNKIFEDEHKSVLIDNVKNEQFDIIDIAYNFNNFVLPMVRMLI